MTAGFPTAFSHPTRLPEKIEHPITVRDFRPFIDKFPFDPTYGHSLSQLLAVKVNETAPADFAAFWKATRAEAELLDLRLEFRPTTFRTQTHNVRELYFDSYDGYRVGGWLCEPLLPSTKPIRVEVIGHGYGGREAPDLSNLPPHVIKYFPCAPGFHLSSAPARVVTNCGHLHVLTGIHSKETYILRASAAAFWGAARVMEALHPNVPIVYRGGSFGGGIGAIMLPWEPRYRAAELIQPTFGYHTFRLAHRCQGSGESVRRIHELAPMIRQTLAFYDSAFAAREIRIPVVLGVCAFDPAVCPPGQFAVANSVPAEFRKLSLFSFGHCEFPVPGLEQEGLRHASAVESLFSNL